MLPALLSRAVDLRKGETRPVLQAFAALFLIIAAHTTLETARDTIFLTKLPPAELNVMYVVLAGLTLVVAGASTRLALRFGRRNTLIFSLVLIAYGAIVFYFLSPTPTVAFLLYVFSGLAGALLAPQFWLLAARLFTVAQGRRLFGPIAAGGVLGGVAGAGGAMVVLRSFPVTALLPVAAALFLATSLLLTTVRVEEPAEDRIDAPAPVAFKRPAALFRENPFLVRVAALVGLSTAAVLVVDYTFKTSATRFVASADLGEFFATYYAVLNGVSLVVQVFLAGRITRSAGVIGSLAVMPFLLLAGGVAALVVPGVFLVVLILKGTDGGLRYSLNRVATELLYLPLPGAVREQGKTLIDSSLSRVVQAATAIILYLPPVQAVATPAMLALVVAVLSAAWLATAVSLRGAYLNLFRRTFAAGGIGPEVDVPELDLRSAEVLVETLASPDPVTVTAAMDVLEQHRHIKLVPALVLYHESEVVLLHALDVFGRSARRDWVPLAERLLTHSSEEVRIGATRALARVGSETALASASRDPSWRVRAYAAFYRAHHESAGEVLLHPLVAAVMGAEGEVGRDGRKGLLAAIADDPDERAATVLLALAERRDLDEADVEVLAGAMARLADPRFIPACIGRLNRRTGREAVRDALVAIGEPALDALERALADHTLGRSLRLHLPRSISPFGSQRASDVLVAAMDSESDGLVRYKILRALGQTVARFDVKIDRPRIEAMVEKNLEEHLRLLALRTALGSKGVEAGDLPGDPSAALLDELLADKVRQSLERAFRLLKIAHKREDIHRVHTAALSSNRRARANAGEFLDTLLSRRDQQALRAVLRIVIDDATDAERVTRAIAEGRALPGTHDAALAVLVDNRDDALAALASRHAATSSNASLRAEVERVRRVRPALRALSDRLFGEAVTPEMNHG